MPSASQPLYDPRTIIGMASVMSLLLAAVIFLLPSNRVEIATAA